MVLGNSNIKPSPLPSGWVWTALGDVCLTQGGFAFKSADYKTEGIPLLRISNIEKQQVTFDKETVYLASSYIYEYEDFKVTKGDILIALSGATTGKYGIYKQEKTALLNQRVGRLKFYNEAESLSKYVFYYVEIIRSQILKRAYGAAQPNISTFELSQFELPLPPLPEQRRIVAKIEELFTKLDAGVEALKKVKAELKRYRQSVLKHAFEGKLTAEFRSQNSVVRRKEYELEEVGRIAAEPIAAYRAGDDEKADFQNDIRYEPANVLLERIRKERKRTLGKKYKDLPPIDTSSLPELPEGWARARVGEIADSIQYGFTASAIQEKVGPKFLRITDIQNGNVDWNEVPYCNIEGIEKDKYLVKEGDLVFARTGATVGKSYLIKKDAPEAVFASYLIRIRVNPNINRNFLYSFFQSTDYWRQISDSQVGIGQPNVNGTRLAQIVIPLPPTAEQEQIVSEIDRRFSIADEVEKVVDQGLKQAERLRQSILKRAFEGKLVSQDPNDEPAEKLLERIKAEKEKNITARNAKNRKGVSLSD